MSPAVLLSSAYYRSAFSEPDRYSIHDKRMKQTAWPLPFMQNVRRQLLKVLMMSGKCKVINVPRLILCALTLGIFRFSLEGYRNCLQLSIVAQEFFGNFYELWVKECYTDTQ